LVCFGAIDYDDGVVCDRKVCAAKSRAKTKLWLGQGGQQNGAVSLTSSSLGCAAEDLREEKRTGVFICS